MEYHIEKLASPNAVVGEGPVWSSEEKKIYWKFKKEGFVCEEFEKGKKIHWKFEKERLM